MKHIILLLVFPAALACCNNPEKETVADEPVKSQPTTVSNTTDASSQQFELLLQEYYRLKDACGSGLGQHKRGIKVGSRRGRSTGFRFGEE